MWQGVNNRGLAENCIKDAARITLVRAIAGDTVKLARMGMHVRPDGRLATLGAADEDHGKRKSSAVEGDRELLQLLRANQLAQVADILVAEGVTDVRVLREELSADVIERLPVGIIFKNRVSALVQCLHAERDKEKQQEMHALKHLELMRTAPAPTVATSCAALLHFGTASIAVLAGLVAHGAVPVLLAAMHTHSGSALVQKQACALIACLTVSGHHTALVNAGVSSAVLAAMTGHAAHADVQARALSALRLVLFDADNVVHGDNLAVVLEGDAVAVIMAAMRAHGGLWGLQQDACCLLMHLASVNTARRAMLQGGALLLVVQAIQMHLSHADTVREACRALIRMLSHVPHEWMSSAVHEMEAVTLGMLAAMRAHPLLPPLLASCCNILYALCRQYEACRDAVVREEGIPVLLAVVETNAVDTGNSVLVLCTLCRTIEHRAAGVQAGAVRVLLATMKTHARNSRVLEHCALYLCNVALCEAHCAPLVLAQAIPILMASMQAHRKRVTLQGHACGTLHNIASSCREGRETVARAGGVREALAAMAAHPQEASIQEIGSMLLRNLSVDSSAQLEITREGGIPVILAAMDAFRGVQKVQLNGCVLLNNIMVHGESGQEQVALGGGASSLLAAMDAHPDSRSVAHGACLALRFIVAHPENQTAMADAGGIRVLLNAMAQYVADISVYEPVCTILCGLGSSHAKIQVRIKDAGGEPVLAQALGLELLPTPCRKLIQRLLDALSKL